MSMKELVVCKYTGCKRVYVDARILPCGKRTCAAHIDAMKLKDDAANVAGKMIKCHFCERIHRFPDDADGEFPPDENIPLLLSMKHSDEHEAAKKSFYEVTRSLEQLATLDKEQLVRGHFKRVQADIAQRKELHMQKLLEDYGRQVERAQEREAECLRKLKSNKQLASELDTMRQTLADELKKQDIGFALHTLDGDEAKWKAIRATCTALLKKIKSFGDELKERIVGGETAAPKTTTIELVNSSPPPAMSIDIEVAMDEDTTPRVDQPPVASSSSSSQIDSTILSSEQMKSDLVALCKLGGKKLRLIYRASRDGFRAKCFHAKCDAQPRTLTVIKSFWGNVFGAYASVAWDSKGGHKADRDAFIFSLVNALSKPQLMPVRGNGQYSLFCDAAFAPTFGYSHDICIEDNSNMSVGSYAQLGGSYEFAAFPYGSPEANAFLGGAILFKTKEIEVFCLE